MSNKEKLRDLISEGCGEFVREPRLEHLMRAIPAKKELICVFVGGQVAMRYENCLFGYDLTKPPLDQSEEVINKLIKILE